MYWTCKCKSFILGIRGGDEEAEKLIFGIVTQKY
jgi:hypothetical protein